MDNFISGFIDTSFFNPNKSSPALFEYWILKFKSIIEIQSEIESKIFSSTKNCFDNNSPHNIDLETKYN